MSDNTAEIVREVVSPDGCKYDVHADGTWEQYTWDGSFVRDHTTGSTSPEEVVAKLGL